MFTLPDFEIVEVFSLYGPHMSMSISNVTTFHLFSYLLFLMLSFCIIYGILSSHLKDSDTVYCLDILVNCLMMVN